MKKQIKLCLPVAKSVDVVSNVMDAIGALWTA